METSYFIILTKIRYKEYKNYATFPNPEMTRRWDAARRVVNLAAGFVSLLVPRIDNVSVWDFSLSGAVCIAIKESCIFSF